MARVPLENLQLSNGRHPDMEALDNALCALKSFDERQSRIVGLRYFVGLTLKEVSVLEGISLSTTKREWETARAWLYRELRRD